MQQQDDTDSTPSAPLLCVPGQDALVRAQARVKSNQMSSKLRLLVHDAGDVEDKRLTSDVNSVYNPIKESSMQLEGTFHIGSDVALHQKSSISVYECYGRC